MPKSLGGLGIRKLKSFNSALQAKKIWRIMHDKREWRDIMEDKYFTGPTYHQLFSEEIPKGSIIWNGLLRAKDIAKCRAKWRLGNGDDIDFWKDNWLIQGPLINTPSFDRWAEACIQRFNCKARDYR